MIRLRMMIGHCKGFRSPSMARCIRETPQRRFFFGGFRFLDNAQVVPNKGSIARDVLAAERTFLAWSRTGLGFVGAGSAMFAAYHRYGNDSLEPNYPASGLLVANGAFLLAFATRRYLKTVAALTQDKFPIDTRGTLLAVLVTATSTITSLSLIIQDELESYGGNGSKEKDAKAETKNSKDRRSN